MSSKRSRRVKAEFIPNGPQLEALTGFSATAVRNQHSTGRGALVPILVKFGNRLGVWMRDWDALVESQRRFPSDRAAA